MEITFNGNSVENVFVIGNKTRNVGYVFVAEKAQTLDLESPLVK